MGRDSFLSLVFYSPLHFLYGDLTAGAHFFSKGNEDNTIDPESDTLKKQFPLGSGKPWSW